MKEDMASTDMKLKLNDTNCEAYRIVNCFTMSPPLPVTPPSLDIADAAPGFFSKIFQNLRLSSAARINDQLLYRHLNKITQGSPAVASIWPSGLKQLWRTLVSCAGISTFRTKEG